MQEISYLRILHSAGGDESNENKFKLGNVLAKVIGLIIILGLALLFGFLPYFCKICRKSTRIIGLANAFSGGIFLGIALFHLLPESAELMKAYFNPEEDHDHEHEEAKLRKLEEHEESIWEKLPLPYMIAFLSYSLILFIEKVAFNSHALIDHDHGDGGHDHGHDDQELKSHSSHEEDDHDHNDHKHDKDKKKANKVTDDNSDSDKDEDEEALKNVISSKGQLASAMYVRNQTNSCINNNPNALKQSLTDNNFRKSIFGTNKRDNALERSSLIIANILSKSFSSGPHSDFEDNQLLVKPANLKATVIIPIATINQKSNNITPYLLLIALSMHGFFEGFAMGIQAKFENTIFLAIAIISHKWAESFTLVI